MTANFASAANAYAAAARVGQQQLSNSTALKDAGDFSEMVKSAIGDVHQSGQATEAKVASVAAGQANVVDLVTAVAETEVAVQTLVTVRDKVISAYKDIMNMPI